MGPLLERVECRALPIIRWFGLDREDGEDVLQETFLVFLRKRDDIQNPETWMLGTLRKQCLMLLRRRRQWITSRLDEAVLLEFAELRGSPQATRDLRHDLERVLLDLPLRCRELLRLRYVEGCKPAETAGLMGYKQSGIYKLVERCLAAFSRQLVSLGYDTEGKRKWN